jgi:hypothetical protein
MRPGPILTGMVLRPALLIGAATYVAVLCSATSAKWPYGLIAVAGAVGLWESNLTVYRLLRSSYIRRRAGRYLQVCALWMVNLIANLGLLNLAVQLALPGTFESRTGSVSAIDVLYFTVLTFASGGYGDILPASATGKVLSMVTTLVGFFYASTLCAVILQQLSAQRRH